MEQCLSSYVELIDSDSNWPVLSSIKSTFWESQPQLETCFKEVKINKIEEIEKIDNFELIKLYLETKEEKVWEEFYFRFNRCIGSYVKGALLNYKDSILFKEMEFLSLQEDLMQEVYVKLLSSNCKALREYRDKNKCFYAYLHRIAVNAVSDHFRKLNFQKRQALIVPLEKADDKLRKDFFDPKIGSYNLILLRCELEDFLSKGLSTIHSKRNKKIFVLFTILGMSSKEIIQMFDSSLTIDTIENVVKNTRKRIKKLLDKPLSIS